MKKGIVLLSFAVFGFCSAKAQIIGDKDITENYNFKYLEVVVNAGVKTTITASWGYETKGFLMDKNGKKVKLISTAAVFEYLDQFGWKYMDTLIPATMNNGGKSTFMFKRKLKKSK